ncbi:metal ABC transporter solute-binding protein, Zn/Mn family [Saccharomonospora halophila]|uniref:metal ABC transporter solute-binding protein, Zn/Mn family n=1 Tax=Saccharomonospora halophila TaxID=129922 RepID=UPI00036C8B0A|nr:zinc ABC transporter substrate-binding protein [Saccharomonospora halophila]
MRCSGAHSKGWLTVAALGSAVALTATACGGGNGAGDGDASGDGGIAVVASTNVWASVVKAVGGPHVEVSALIEDPSDDPHSYQADAEDAADVQSADFLVSNGGGYDDFFTELADRAPDVPTVVAVDSAPGHGTDDGNEAHEGAEHGSGGQEGHGDQESHDGHEGHEHGSGNEHVWYDLPVVAAVAERTAERLGEVAPDQRDTFRRNAAAFTDRVDELSTRVDGITDEHGGARVAATAPVAHYLLADAGIEDVTPREFTAAIENETDVPVAAQQRMLELVSGSEVSAVVRNVQTVSAATGKIVEEARGAGVPVVDVTETLPEGENDYIAWMGAQIDALSGALSG